jgi:hypothetical protein
VKKFFRKDHNVKRRIKIDELKQTAEWALCSPKEQEWLTHFLKTRDAVAATKATFPNAKNQNFILRNLRDRGNILALVGFVQPELPAAAVSKGPGLFQRAHEFLSGKFTLPKFTSRKSLSPVLESPLSVTELVPASVVVEPQHTEIDDASELQAKREFYLSHPLEFANEVLGFELAEENELLFDAILDEGFSDCLLLWPRASGKSTTLIVACVLSLIRNPNLRILWATADADLGARRLRQLADCFDSPTEKFRRLWPEFCGLERRTAKEIFIKGRTNPAVIDASFSTTTILSDNIGSRADLLICDDIVSEANSISENSRANTFARLQNLRGLKSGSAKMIVSGTFFHTEDAYARILEGIVKDERAGLPRTWCVEYRGIWRHLCLNCGHKDVLHDAKTNSCKVCEREGYPCEKFEHRPEKASELKEAVLIDARRLKDGGTFGYSIAELESERGSSKMGPEAFAKQYELNADPAATGQWPKFTPEFIATHTVQNRIPLVASFIITDLGFSKKVVNSNEPLAKLNDPDYTVAVAVVLYGDQAVAVDCIRGRWNPGDLAAPVFDFWNKHNFVPLFGEDLPIWGLLKRELERRAPAMRDSLREIPVSNERNAKLIRGARLFNSMASGEIAISIYMPGYDLLRQELLSYPQNFEGHNDMRDCLSFIPQARIYLPGASSFQANQPGQMIARSQAEWDSWTPEQQAVALTSWNDRYVWSRMTPPGSAGQRSGVPIVIPADSTDRESEGTPEPNDGTHLCM